MDEVAHGDATRAHRRPRLEDVAARVGMSPASVSMVLTGAPGPSAATRERVLEAAAELGYRPDRTASLLARRRTHLIGVLLEVRSAFHAELVEDLQEAAEQQGYDVVLNTVTRTRDERRAVETLVDFRCEALVLLGPEAAAGDLRALAQQLPVVVIGRRVDADGVDVVRSADAEGVGQAVDHLVGLGHRPIAFIDGGRGTIASDRRRGYRTAMRRHRLGEHIRVIPGDHTEAAGTRAAQALLGDGSLPSAVMASNDRCALGFLDALNRAGVAVPGAVSVVGYDDSTLSRLAHVNLTTVSQDARRQGGARGGGGGRAAGPRPDGAPRGGARPAPGGPRHDRGAQVSQRDAYTAEEWRTLQFAPFWIFSAVIGAYDRYDQRDYQAFVRCLEAAALAEGRLGREVLASVGPTVTG